MLEVAAVLRVVKPARDACFGPVPIPVLILPAFPYADLARVFDIKLKVRQAKPLPVQIAFCTESLR